MRLFIGFSRSLISLFVVTSRKYEEISPPHVEEFCYITDNTYKKEEVMFIYLFLFQIFLGLLL